MFHTNRRSRAAATAALMALLVALSVAVPLLDRGGGVGPHAVSDGETPIGWVDHDHQICLQHSAMAWLPGVGVRSPVETLPVADQPIRRFGKRSELTPHSSHQPRAPPRL